jgi:hypothetical protein
LAIWFALAPLQFETREDFFRSSDTGETSASQRFNQQLSTLINKHKDESAVHIRVDHANTHSIRKGSGTYSQSGTTAPPPATATAGRGEWSLGKVFDLYLFLAEPADTYLGRILAGLDPNKDNFATLPPHFTECDPMHHDDTKKAMSMMYDPILQQWGGTDCDPTGLLL